MTGRRRNTEIPGLILLMTFFYFGNGCQIEGITNWWISQQVSLLDTFRGNVFDRSTSNIEGINSISYSEGLNRGPYLDVSFLDSRFTISTNAAFADYEEYETLDNMGITVTFRCTGGSSSILVFSISVVDTNNNAPQFRPTNQFSFSVAPPLPPGFSITGCFNDITVRDIDLTTQRIDFGIEDNPYFEIDYDTNLSTEAKEFQAVLRTKAFIRSLPEPVSVVITATDVDLTGDPQLTTSATVTITADTEFEFPEEPVFSQAFYLADYTDDNQLVLAEPIILQSGFHEAVNFSLTGEYSSNFRLVQNNNQVQLEVATPLPSEVLTEKQIILVVRADREYASGGSATIIVRLPQDVALEFERPHYVGTIENNILQIPSLILTEGYEDRSVSAVIISEHSSFFNALVQGNTITLSMSQLNENVINENNFIYLRVDATTDRSIATAIVTLEIIKDDNVTPVFNRPIYTGSYDPESGLTLDEIVFVQGFDETVSVNVEGDHASFFQVVQNGSEVSLSVSTIPPAIFNEQRILLSLEATKPRTVGANAAIIITLPAARELDFEESTYRGTLQDNVLTLGSIVLRDGYDEGVTFALTGDYATYFSVSNILNVVEINLRTPLPESIISENNIVILGLTASGLNAVTTTASVLLDIIKDDISTPVFSRNIYLGTYASPLNVDITDINLIQGFDETVTFRLDGDHSQFFEISNTGNNVALSLRTAIPETVIFNEKVLHFNVLAEKPLTVGANAAVLITFPSELTEPAIMRFSQNTYTGSLDNNVLTTDTVILDTGYVTGTQFLLSGDYATYFTLINTNNIISITLPNPLPSDVIENNQFILLEIEARRERAVSVWTSVVIDVIKQEMISPQFAEAYYRGIYSSDTGLQFEEAISLSVGFDETVAFSLTGDFASSFRLVQDGNSLNLTNVTPVTETDLENNNNLLLVVIATKPNAITARSVISIDIHKESSEAVILRFAENNYVGAIRNNQLQVPTITLIGNDVGDVILDITGDHSSYFGISRDASGIISVVLTYPVPSQVIADNTFLVLELSASYPAAVSGYTTIVIEIIKEQTDTPAFERAYYTGEYSEQTGLLFEDAIRLVQGFDESITFALNGDDAQWFTLIHNAQDNSISLTVNGTLPENRSHLVFTVVATNSGISTSAVIIISITDFTTESLLRFTRNYYTGSINGSSLELDQINLEGYSADVILTLSGDFSNYFQITRNSGIITLQLLTELPEEAVTSNNVFILTLEAQIANTKTQATLILGIEKNIDTTVAVVFDEVYYEGSYNSYTGILFETPITLAQGYSIDVEFGLEGENSQWFSLLQTQNSVTLILSSPIPAAVLANNRHLIFLVTARRLDSVTARSTIIITLTDDMSEESSILGFDRVTYLGSIQSNTASLGPIITEGYTNDVSLRLFGDLSSYFRLTNQGAVVSVELQTAIPEESIPSNRIIVLEIQATAPQAISASATIIFETVVDGAVIQPVFAEAFYTGSYNSNTGLLFGTPVTLAQGYGTDVQFSLEGESSQWFSLVQSQNSITLTLSSPIPPAVLLNNRQLVFVIAAQRPASATARTTIVITLTDDFTEEAPILGFDRVSYIGSIQSNTASIGPIILTEGYTNDVSFRIYGDLSSYFRLANQGAVVSVELQTAIPEELIPANRIIVLEIQAAAPQAISASAAIILEVVVQDDTVIQPVFAEAFYTGSYNSNTGLLFETPVTLAQGYGTDVQFSLEGESSQWFSLVQSQKSITLTLSSPIPPAVLLNNRQLVFVIAAQRPASATARTTIVITLTDDFTEEAPILGFDRVSYIGSIQSNTASIGPITLTEGYTNDVSFRIYGDLSSYFRLTNQGAVVSVELQTAIPEELIPANRIIVLEIQAAAPQAISASAAIILEVVVQDDTVIQPVFAEAFYTGSYNSNTGLLFETPVTLAQGYGTDVQFSLEGESSQWFSLVQSQNSITLTLSSPIPPAVLLNNRQLVFVIAAQRPASATARTTIVITLTDDFTEEAPILGFDRVSYIGSIQSNTASIGPITLTEGYTNDVSFRIYGDLSSYFRLTNQGAVVSVELQTAIPEELIPANRIIVLEIQAAAPQAISASAAIILEVVVQDDTVIQPVFAEAFYTGSYNSNTGLLFETAVTLAQGYGTDVQFSLEGESSQWFSLVQSQNSITLTLSSPIPPAVLLNNRQLVFVIAAQRPASATARTTIVITLTDDFTEEAPILGFDRVSYIGSIESNTASLGPITLTEGYTNDVSFRIYGDLSSYFRLTNQGAVVSVELQTAIPEELIPANRIIVLEIQAAAPQAISASAAIILEVVVQDDTVIQPVFAEAFYTGSYNSNTGLLFETPVTLAQGYGTDVQFSLEGESSQWFSLVQSQNSITLTLSSPIPPAVLLNNRQLVFVIAAQRPASATARTTIVITLTDDFTEEAPILGFDRVSYIGSIQSNTASIGPITLTEGYTNDVSFRIYGDLSSYFRLTNQGAVVSVELLTAIPEELIPANRIIVLEIQAAAPQAISASAAIILEVVVQDDTVIQPVFAEAFYTGSYNSNTGLLFETPVTLAQGYGTDVQFSLEGESSQWFSLVQSQNSITLTLSSPIPPAVLLNNRQLVFVIAAQRPASATARTTIVITLTDDFTEEAPILGFDRVSYIGSIQSNTASIGPIRLTEGYTNDVSFRIYGDLSSYFRLTNQGAVVSVELQTAIPEELIPANRIIVLEIQAAAPQAISASAAIILEVVVQDDTVIQPVFAEAFYTGSYNSNTGLLFETAVTLAQGYGTDVQFSLEGESSQWFSLVQSQNSITLTLSSPIPPAVLLNNRQLVFVIAAQRPASATARTTIVITLTDDFTEEAPILGFDRVSYIGSIESNTASLGPITLTEGYTNDVSFRIYGDLSSYFRLTNQGAVVSVELQTAIPEELIPANRIIVLEIQAAAPQAISASAAIILEVVVQDDTVIQPVFAEAFYTGSYNSNTGLLFETPVTLAQGYGTDVQFSLEGESSQWFSLVQSQNSITLTLSSPIPPAVLLNNRQLVFVIAAQRPASATARTTIVITLTDDFTEEAPILGFDRVSYIGSIQSNTASIGPITLTEGYTNDVSFRIYGDLSSYFRLTNQGAVVSVELLTAIPEELIPANRIIVLEIQAAAPQAISASAAIILEVVVQDDTVIQPVFAEAFYTGSYNSNTGLLFETPVTLAQGYGTDVQFSLEGESSQWFSLVQSQNSITLTLSSPIPPAVLLNNRQLVFVIAAQRPASATARTTIVITLTDDFTEEAPILGFDRVSYIGSIQSNTASIGPIRLTEGYTNDVSFRIYGDLSSYFRLTNQGAVVSVELQTAIPEELIPANRIIVLEIQAAAPQAISASAAIILEVVVQDDTVIQPVFAEAFYTGSYNSNTGLLFETAVTLAQGYGTDVQFSLEGESSQWFSLVQSQNSIILTLSSPIPPAVLLKNRQLVFVIAAQRPASATARTTIVITLTDDFTEEAPILGFDRVSYIGSIQSNTASIGPITLTEGYTNDVSFRIYGDLSSYFRLTNQGAVVSVELQTAIPEELIPANRIIVLEIQAAAPQAISASAAIILEVVVQDDTVIQPVFAEAFYTGSYNSNTGLLFETPVTLAQGYGTDVQFSLEGESSQWFSLVQSQNSITLTLSSPIPPAVLLNNRQLVFVIAAQRPASATARTTIVITLTDDFTEEAPILGFDRVSYIGSIESNTASIGPITLTEGYTNDVSFRIYGDLSSYFRLTNQGAVVSVEVQTAVPEELIPANRIIVLEIQAVAPQAISASATIIFEVVVEDDSVIQPVFAEAFYTGSYSTNTGLLFASPITLAQGYGTDIEFSLGGESSQWFSIVRSQNSITLTLSSVIPPAVLFNNRQLVFVITAQRPGSAVTTSTIVISLSDDFTEGTSILGFDRVSYIGSIQSNTVSLGSITLIEGFGNDVSFRLFGDLSSYFEISNQGAVVTVILQTPIPEQLIPANRILVLEIQATSPQAVSASATIIFEIVLEDDTNVLQPVFEEAYYIGSYDPNTGLIFETPISLIEGYNVDIVFSLEGESAQWFSLLINGNSVTLTLERPIPDEVLANNRKLVIVISAQKTGSAVARAAIVISLFNDSQTGTDVSFEKVLYEGFIQDGTVRHESIRVPGYTGTTITVSGGYSSLFVAYVAEGVVTVESSGSLTLPADVTSLPLELHATGDRAVLLLNVLQSDVPTLPTVSFSSESYAIRVEISQTGQVGQVQATADNGETILYTLALDNAHLQSRLSINNGGELHLSAPADSGAYTFQIIATSAITQTTATATVHLLVEATVVCGDDIVVPPLIILDRDEEEPHQSLVVSSYPGCRFTLSNRWPTNQSWLYVDDDGLHTTAIDREHPSIAYMALSQVKVELLLQCDADNAIRTKRSLRTDWLGPYDYGTNKWILADTITYNARRSIVNLIVNDINDNAPIFVGKEDEPIAVGYPTGELEEAILPRSLAELEATDADIGLNADLLYWSEEQDLAVAPTTGYVHVRNGAQLRDNQALLVHATDRNGEGLTGSIQLLVKLLDKNNIAVVTVRDAFLDDENTILAKLSDAVGYNVKTLRSIVISDDIDGDDSSRKKRETNTAGASLQLYVYGLIAREPVAVERLTVDINNNAIATVNVISTVLLEDHLNSCEICVIPGRDTALLVSTIVLSVLLFILIVLIALWLFLRWRKNKNYDQFSDENSVASRNDSMASLAKAEVVPKPRLNIEELKKSERRLQEMLNAPVDQNIIEPTTSKRDNPFDAVLDLDTPEPQGPIVIQSIDKLKDAGDTSDDDEFGEKSGIRRKSVVTFNENVEKIIHVEDDPEDIDVSEHPGYEIYKL